MSQVANNLEIASHLAKKRFVLYDWKVTGNDILDKNLISVLYSTMNAICVL